MVVHLLKTAAGVPDLDTLAARQAQFTVTAPADSRAAGRPVVLHSTRNMPRRRDAVLDGGSIYWIVRREIAARNRILDMVEADDEMGPKRCRFLLDPELVAVARVHRRPIQGWRYLPAAEAPRDLAGGPDGDSLPPHLARDLADLGLL
ncbi:hypothetical protein EV659_108124 [Rhodothalassium salexigens DSM 2132]|uniref:DUF1489 family protein n=1 Tax=Rhodothalassium salexigens DSM 2132 TaxID=1188247 RepID=A0A4R2PEV2_RHOSA|nr:DUF1489 domain-containing protein [Rhodothalassium salexigens]MBB4212150.1 hypothetical protein [Rhodothalassium salexigens DSM 2132]MBK1638182.1 hypothetical protein [Rhodothalassium salexigens DSM 2132]TCP33024.1 hypothetical protein EV659_108124 [Rhodothalassium salexigens DSM 2132]